MRDLRADVHSCCFGARGSPVLVIRRGASAESGSNGYEMCAFDSRRVTNTKTQGCSGANDSRKPQKATSEEERVDTACRQQLGCL